jgi:hypothetical protein
MSEYTEEMERRHRAEIEARGRIGAMFIFFFFLVALPAWVFVGWYFLGLFRTTPLKGTKHPNKTANSTNGTDVARVEVKPRWWVYQHPPTNTSRIGPEEEAYRKKREEIAKKQAEKEDWLVRFFEIWYATARIGSPDLLGEGFFSGFIDATASSRMLEGRGMKTELAIIPPSESVLAKSMGWIQSCLSASNKCDSRVFGHLHYGDDSDKYYDVRNSVFVSIQDGFIRLIVIDVARLGQKLDGSPEDVSVALGLFNTENPLTDEAWHVDPLYPDTEDAMELSDATFKKSTMVYDKTFPPILNFLNQAMDGMLGLRFTELVGLIQPPNGGSDIPEVKLVHGDTHVMYTKIRQAKKKTFVVESANVADQPDRGVGIESIKKDEF